MSLSAQLESYRDRINRQLLAILPSPDQPPARLHQAMHYAVMNGGKRIRPLLVYACGEALQTDPGNLDAAACAVELIHSYSLVHDDLPAMDNDELRRGKPTCHIQFDEATALLVGDALQSLAFEQLSSPLVACTPVRQLDMIKLLSQASGSRGMAGGQAIDLQSVGQQLDLHELKQMHAYKTGALIDCSIRLALLASNQHGNRDLEQKLTYYAQCVGLAFQIQDDILDVESDTQTLGKPQGSDEARNKPTYVSLMGLEEAKRNAQQLLNDALDSISSFGAAANNLSTLACFIIQRSH